MTRPIAVITGASSGVGRGTACNLSKRGWHVVLAVRRPSSAIPVVDRIVAEGGTADICELDLSSLDSVRHAARKIASLHDHIDLLINNAGIAGAHGKTKDGFEIHFGVNHLGHYLLTRLLLPRLLTADSARIVNVSSGSHYEPLCLNLSTVRSSTSSVTGLSDYERSKLCNVIFTAALRDRLQGTNVTAVSLHPGQVRSRIWRRIPQPIRWFMTRKMLYEEQAAENVVYCSLPGSSGEHPRLFYDEQTPAEPSPIVNDERAVIDLWQKSAEWVGLEAQR